MTSPSERLAAGITSLFYWSSILILLGVVNIDSIEEFPQSCPGLLN